MKICLKILIAVFSISALCIAEQAKLQIYLPREIIVEDEVINLDSVCILRGDENLVSKISKTSLGKFSMVGQKIILDRPAILSRIASQGVNTENVLISGSKSVTVKRNEDIIDDKQIINIAENFIKTLPQMAGAEKINIVKKPKPWILTQAMQGNIELKPRMNRYQVSGITRLFVDIVLDGVVIGTRDISFDVRYKRQAAIAKRDISPGEIFSPVNISIETVENSPSPSPRGWAPPYGQVAKVSITKGKEITDAKSEPVILPVAIKRRQMVVVKLETPMLTVSSIGEAMMDGKTGEFIKVKVGAGREAREINARIKSDGTLEPFYEGMKL